MPNIYFHPIETIKSVSSSATDLLELMVNNEEVIINKDLPVKIHPGAIGNTAYIKPENYNGIISYLKKQSVKPYFIETCMASSTDKGKLNEFKSHGFTQLPVVIADGHNGSDHVEIAINKGKHLKYSLIAKKLAQENQVLVISHFKGHCMAGFGGAIKMLGIGFASGIGKTLVHGIKNRFDPGDKIDWKNSHKQGISKKWVENWNTEVVSAGDIFRERFTESALAASRGKNHLYLTFAINIVNNCDCDGKALTPVYKDVGIFAGLDPVAIDKAVFDVMQKRDGDTPFEGEQMFQYAKNLGLGSTHYNLIKVS